MATSRLSGRPSGVFQAVCLAQRLWPRVRGGPDLSRGIGVKEVVKGLRSSSFYAYILAQRVVLGEFLFRDESFELFNAGCHRLRVAVNGRERSTGEPYDSCGTDHRRVNY